MRTRWKAAATGTAAAGLPESYLQTEIKILQSDSVLKRALDQMPKMPVTKPEERSLSLFSGWVRMPGPKQESLDDLVADASHRIKVRVLGNTRIVEILCDGRDGQIAANMCNNLAQTLILRTIWKRVTRARLKPVQWLKSQRECTASKLTQTESELKDSARESHARVQ